MIDLHNHILPGVDDGARSVEEACDMARALLTQNVSAVCCTPHTTDWAAAGNAAAIERRVEDLRATFADRGVPLALMAGAEVHLAPALAADVQAGKVPTLNGTSYLLLEFPYDFLPPHFERVVFELQVKGILPVIAHPERIAPIAEDPSILYGLVKRGCLGQLTAMSLAGGFGPRVREVSELMLEHHLVHLIASDAHDAQPGSRLFALNDARAAAVRLMGESRAAALFESTPAAIAANAAVEASDPLEYKKRHFAFLRAFR
jgi:protein-tyrosine phosphatase